MRRAARALGAGVVLAAAVLLTLTGLLYYRPLPTIDGYFRLLGLDERGSLVRDTLGIPHVYAQDLHDLFFLQGYVTAQDRLAQMESMRSAAPRAATELARTSLARASAQLRDALDAYAAGVSKLIAQYGEARALPPELVIGGRRPAPWQPADSLAIVSAHLERPLPASVCATAASARTLKGQPVMAADVYLDAPDPGWYEIGLDGADVRAVGMSLPGVPGIAAGHNGWVAWALMPRARPATDPVATLAGLLEALPAHAARSFTDALLRGARGTGNSLAACVADIQGNVGAIDRGQVAFVPPERAAVLGGEGGRGAALVAKLDGARGLDVEGMRALLGRPPASVAGARLIVDLGDVDTSRSAVSRGESGLRASPHFGDQAALWEIGEAHRLAFSRPAIVRIDGELVLRAR